MLSTQTAEKFVDTSLFLDGIRFVRCTFVNCQLIYEGRDDVDFQDCTFENCSWTLGAAAERTVNFLSILQRRTGATGLKLVDEIFDSLRTDSIFGDEGTISSSESINVKTARAS